MATTMTCTHYEEHTMTIARRVMAERQPSVEFNADDSLTDVGMSSLDLVGLMLAVEAEFDIMIPPSYLKPERFRSVSAIARMVESIRHGA